jgi:hypothetical protein
MQKTKTYCSYDINGFYIGTGEAQNSPKHEEIGKEWYMLPANATFIAVPNFNAELEIPKFDTDTEAWSVVDVEIQGIFYLKTDATELAEIAKKDADLYTQIEPLQKYDDGTAQAFNDATQTWEYTFKGGDLLEAERVEALNTSKQDRIAQLEADYSTSKKITLKNGTTWVIEGATYKALKDKLTLIFSENADLTKVYTFFEGDASKPNYYVNVLCYIWRYILKDFYENVLEVGNNRKIYDFAKADIMNAQDLTTLNNITWSFTPAEVIDVSGKAAELEKLSDTPQYVLDVIAAAKDADGEIHLVQRA